MEICSILKWDHIRGKFSALPECYNLMSIKRILIIFVLFPTPLYTIYAIYNHPLCLLFGIVGLFSCDLPWISERRSIFMQFF